MPGLRHCLLLLLVPLLRGQPLEDLANPDGWVRFPTAPGIDWTTEYDLVEWNDRIWIAQATGLYSFDGYSWTHHQQYRSAVSISPSKSDQGSMLLVYQRKLYRVDPQERLTPLDPGLAVATATEVEPGRYFLLNREGLWDWRPPQAPNKIPNPGYIALRMGAQLRGSSFWWMTGNSLMRGDAQEPFLAIPRSYKHSGDFTVDLIEERAGQGGGMLYVSSPRLLAGLWEWKPGETRPTRTASEGTTSAAAGGIDPLSGDKLIVYREGEVRIGRNGRWSSLSWVPPHLGNALRLIFSPNGDLWAASPAGLSLFRRHQRWFHSMHPFPDQRNNVSALLAARDGRLWVGTQGGLTIYRSPDDSAPQTITQIQGKDLDIVTGLNEDRNGHIWVSSGAAISGAWRWDGHHWTHFGAGEGLTDQRIHKIHRDRRGDLWFLSTGRALGDSPRYAGAFHWDGRAFHRWSQENGMDDNSVYAFDEDPDGNYWFFSAGSVNRYSASGKWRSWRRKPGPGGEKQPWNVFYGKAGSAQSIYWIDRANGLMHLNPAENWPQPVATPGMSLLRELRLDRDGALWITSDKGLGVLRHGEFTLVPHETGLQRGRLWPLEFWRGQLCVGHLGRGWSCLADQQEEAHRVDRITLHEERRSTLATASRKASVSWQVASFWGEIPPETIPARARIDNGPWTPWSRQSRLEFSELWPGEHLVEVQTKGPFGTIFAAASQRVFFQGPIVLRPSFYVPLLAGLALLVTAGVVLVRRQRTFQRQLRARDDRFRALIEKSSEGLFLLSPEGIFHYVSPSVERLLGRTEQEMIHRENWDLYAEEDLPEVRRRMRQAAAATQPIPPFRRRMFHRQLGWRWFELTVSNLMHDPAIGAIVVVFRDVTQQEEQAASLARAKEEAESASRAKSDFLATMSHEIRTPMNGVLGMAALLSETPLSAEQAGFVQSLRESGATLLALVNDILDISRIESGRLQLERTVFSPHRLLQEITGLWRPSAAMKGIALEVHFHGCPEETWTWGDPARLRQVISNLVSNALKFTSAGMVEIQATLEGGTLQVAVRDTGIGIAPDKLDRIFEKFTQADSSTTRRFGGTGLGLTISRQLVELMGGDISVTSTLGQGSRFLVQLPIEIAPESATASLAELAQATGEQRQLPPGLRILVAEDNIVNQRVTKAFLERRGCQVSIAADGRAALELWREHEFDLILMDCQMPEMDGYTATQRIREMEAGHRRTPIVALTANAMAADREHCLAAGMDSFLAKPLDFAELTLLMQAMCTPASAIPAWIQEQK